MPRLVPQPTIRWPGSVRLGLSPRGGESARPHPAPSAASSGLASTGLRTSPRPAYPRRPDHDWSDAHSPLGRSFGIAGSGRRVAARSVSSWTLACGVPLALAIFYAVGGICRSALVAPAGDRRVARLRSSAAWPRRDPRPTCARPVARERGEICRRYASRTPPLP